MKKNWIMRSAYLALAVLLISTVAVSGTFARYTWSQEGITDTARVALFQFKINETVIDNAGDTVVIDLFSTILDTKDDAAETDVDNDETLIAPGVKGAFNLGFENLSEVTVAVAFDAVLTKSDATIPLEFTLTPDDDASWNADAATVIAGLNDATVATDDAATGAVVYWRWVFDGDNDVDTALGFEGTATATLTVDITVDQVD